MSGNTYQLSLTLKTMFSSIIYLVHLFIYIYKSMLLLLEIGPYLVCFANRIKQTKEMETNTLHICIDLLVYRSNTTLKTEYNVPNCNNILNILSFRSTK